MSVPVVVRQGGIVSIRSDVDAAFRNALMSGVPASLRVKMMEALSAQVQPNARRAMREARKYFGDEADEAFASAAALASELHRYLEGKFQLRGLLDWLTVTGYGNDYRMIKVFYEWSKLEVSKRENRNVLIGPDDHLG